MKKFVFLMVSLAISFVHINSEPLFKYVCNNDGEIQHGLLYDSAAGWEITIFYSFDGSVLYGLYDDGSLGPRIRIPGNDLPNLKDGQFAITNISTVNIQYDGEKFIVVNSDKEYLIKVFDLYGKSIDPSSLKNMTNKYVFVIATDNESRILSKQFIIN